MAITIEPVWDSAKFQRNASGDTATINFKLFGVEADQDAFVALCTSVEWQLFAGAYASDWQITERIADDVYLGSITYVIPAYEDNYEYSFSTSGGTAKITEARATVGAYSISGTAPAIGTAIGVTADGVEGCEIVVPAFSWREKFTIPTSTVDAALLQGLATLTGCVNNDTFKGFAPGEVRFDGAEGNRLNSMLFEISYTFSVSPNAYSVTIGSMTVTEKKGWDYLWVLYAETASNNRMVKTAVAAYVQQVYRYISFGSAFG